MGAAGSFWKRLGRALKVALNIAIDLNDAQVIKVKELDKVKTIRDVVERRVEEATRRGRERPQEKQQPPARLTPR